MRLDYSVDPVVFLEALKRLRDLYEYHMEGCDADEFKKWSSYFAASVTLIEALEEEMMQ